MGICISFIIFMCLTWPKAPTCGLLVDIVDYHTEHVHHPKAGYHSVEGGHTVTRKRGDVDASIVPRGEVCMLAGQRHAIDRASEGNGED